MCSNKDLTRVAAYPDSWSKMNVSAAKDLLSRQLLK